MALQSEKAVHQFGCSDYGENRKKLDVKCLGSEAGESKFDLRKSLAWDAAFFTSPGFLEPEELFHCRGDNGEKASAAAGMRSINNKELDELKYSSRSSLAWDSAFLTSEGVLNAVELCLVNKGYQKSEMHHHLPAIQEPRMSSLSTHTSSSSLSTLELQLFEDPQPPPPPHHHLNEVPKYNIIHHLKRMDGRTQPKMKSLPNPRKQTADHSQKISKEAFTTPSSKQFSWGSEFNPPSSSLKPPKPSGRVKSTEMAPSKSISLLANEAKQDRKHVHITNGKSSIAAGKQPRSPLKSSESENDCHSSSHMKKKYDYISYPVPKSTTACRNHRVRPKGTSYAPRSNADPMLLKKNSGIRLPSPKIGYFDEGEAGREKASENRLKAVKDKDTRKSSKGHYSHQHCEDETKDYCIRNHKMKAELCVDGKSPISHKVDKALANHRQAITINGDDTGDVLIELSTNQGPQKL